MAFVTASSFQGYGVVLKIFVKDWHEAVRRYPEELGFKKSTNAARAASISMGG
jgi:hypothetical protein